MHKYWTAFESEEHFLYANEVAEQLQIFNCTHPARRNELNVLFTGELLKQSSDELGKEAFYYEARHGLKRVFDRETIEHAVKLLGENTVLDKAVMICPAKGKKFRFVIGQDKVKPALVQLHPECFEEDGTYIKNYKRRDERKAEIKEGKKAKA